VTAEQKLTNLSRATLSKNVSSSGDYATIRADPPLTRPLLFNRSGSFVSKLSNQPRKAHVVVPALDDYEWAYASQKVIPVTFENDQVRSAGDDTIAAKPSTGLGPPV
jgi:hypothetical protein